MADRYEYMPETPEFAQFWAAYPKKQNKADAKKAWQQTQMIRPPLEVVLKAVIAQKCSDDWRKDGGRYIPFPSTWLRAEGWENSAEVDLGDVVNGKMWFETTSGVEAKGAELGILPAQFDKAGGWPQFKLAVFKAAGHNVREIKSA